MQFTTLLVSQSSIQNTLHLNLFCKRSGLELHQVSID
jgi:hypothetical protein